MYFLFNLVVCCHLWNFNSLYFLLILSRSKITCFFFAFYQSFWKPYHPQGCICILEKAETVPDVKWYEFPPGAHTYPCLRVYKVVSGRTSCCPLLGTTCFLLCSVTLFLILQKTHRNNGTTSVTHKGCWRKIWLLLSNGQNLQMWW